MHVLQKLEGCEYKDRIEFAQWRLKNIQGDVSLLVRAIYSDERLFHAYEKVNKHNFWIWGTENPRERREVARDSKKQMCGAQCLWIKSFARTTSTAKKVPGKSYEQLLTNCFLPRLSSFPQTKVSSGTATITSQLEGLTVIR